MGLVTFVAFMAFLAGGLLFLAWLAHSRLPRKYAGIALGASVLIGGPALFLLPAVLPQLAVIALPLLLAWLTKRYVPPTYGRLALATLLAVAVGAIATFYLGFNPIMEAVGQERAPRVFQLLLLTALGGLYLSIAFIPSFFERHQITWTGVIAPFVLFACLRLWFYMGVGYACAFGTCP